MELTHSFTVPNSVDDAWSLFMDLERVGSCFPGATVAEVTDDGFSGTVKVKLGPIALVYGGAGSFVARDDVNHRAVIEAKGKDKRGNGTAGATVTVELSPDGDGTRADVVTDLAVTGKPAQFGRGVMQDVSDKLLLAFVACMKQHLSASPPAPDSADREGSFGGEPHGAPGAPGSGPMPAGDSSETHAAGHSATGSAAGRSELADKLASSPDANSPARQDEDEALDLGSAVMPVLIQRYAGFAVAAVVGAVVGWLLGRGTRCRD